MELVSHLEAALDNTSDDTARYHIRAALQYARSLEDDPEGTTAAVGQTDRPDETATDGLTDPPDETTADGLTDPPDESAVDAGE